MTLLYRQELYRTHIRLHRCVSCSRKTNGYVRCNECLEQTAVTKRRWRAARKLVGLCCECREHAVEGKRLCAKHLEASRNRTRTSRQRKAA